MRFFARHKEAVSNQIELLARQNQGVVIAAKRFMGQKALRRTDIADNIFIFPPILYSLLLPIILYTRKYPIHYFEEEPSRVKRWLFNLTRRPLYISMYRRPSVRYVEHLKGYRYLKKVFVELQEHKDILIREGIAPEKIVVAATPAKIPRKRSTKMYDPTKCVVVFASWNNKERRALYERGLLYLLDLLEANPHMQLVIPPRDKKVDEFIHEARKRDVESRIELLDIRSTEELINMYDRADFVAFTAQKRVTKDVPNSLLDGFMRGKPALVSTAIDFHTIVSEHDIGIVIPVGAPAERLIVTPERYAQMANNAYHYAKNHTQGAYLDISKQLQ